MPALTHPPTNKSLVRRYFSTLEPGTVTKLDIMERKIPLDRKRIIQAVNDLIKDPDCDLVVRYGFGSYQRPHEPKPEGHHDLTVELNKDESDILEKVCTHLNMAVKDFVRYAALKDAETRLARFKENQIDVWK